MKEKKIAACFCLSTKTRVKSGLKRRDHVSPSKELERAVIWMGLVSWAEPQEGGPCTCVGQILSSQMNSGLRQGRISPKRKQLNKAFWLFICPFGPGQLDLAGRSPCLAEYVAGKSTLCVKGCVGLDRAQCVGIHWVRIWVPL